MTGYIERAANQVADILMREGLDYTQTGRLQAGTRQGWPQRSKGTPRLSGAPDA